jgi:hypothetical protein
MMSSANRLADGEVDLLHVDGLSESALNQVTAGWLAV